MKTRLAPVSPRLLALKWVTIEKASWDRRTNWITLTDEGFTAIDLAIRVTIKRRLHRYFFYNFFKPNRRVRNGPSQKIKVAIHFFVMAIANIAYLMGDRARLEYPMLWDPDI